MSLIRLPFLLGTMVLLGAACTHVSAQTQPQRPADPATIGEVKTAVVLVNFNGDTSQPITKAAVQQLVMGDVSDFFWENSYQQTFLSGDTYGWYTIPVADCDTPLIASEADKAANAAGVDLSGYDEIIYMFPAIASCTWSGTGLTNAAGQTLMFINGTGGMQTKVIAHEFGHRFGLKGHSNGLDCDVSPIGNVCEQAGYGDPGSAMGNRLAHFSATEKEKLGWLGAGNSPAILAPTASGRFRIGTYETKDGTPKALKLLQSTDEATGKSTYYYLEYRQAIGFDAGLASLPSGNLHKGVVIHRGVDGSSMWNYMLDMTPNTILTSKASDFFDGALMPGKTFTDATAGVSVTVVSVDALGATVDVTIAGQSAPPPEPPAPTLSGSVGTDKTSYARNETAYLSALVKRDGAPAAGAAVKFTLTTPNGGTTTLNATSGSDGYARGSYRIGKARNALGGYAVRADATLSGGSASATTSFSVR